jgi:hypothetical protein
MYSLLVTAKLNDVDPRAWLADVLARINDHPASRLHELLPWNWQKTAQDTAAAARVTPPAALAGWITVVRTDPGPGKHPDRRAHDAMHDGVMAHALILLTALHAMRR